MTLIILNGKLLCNGCDKIINLDKDFYKLDIFRYEIFCVHCSCKIIETSIPKESKEIHFIKSMLKYYKDFKGIVKWNPKITDSYNIKTMSSDLVRNYFNQTHPAIIL
jgi:hypothetical protein